MSFLNPVSEPVLRFSSTDADAPQINYAARTAGDVKTVLKACLVTGYGTTASAGWSIVNEVDHVAEFVSPSAAMSDYRLGIDDTSVSSTTWYYQFQGVRTNPKYNDVEKNISSISSASNNNQWQLLVTARGICLIESFDRPYVSGLSSRIVFIAQNKLAVSHDGCNITFFNAGHDGASDAYRSYQDSFIDRNITGFTSPRGVSASPLLDVKITDYVFNMSVMDMAAAIYLYNNDILLGQQVGMLINTVNNQADLYVLNDTAVDGRQMLQLCLGYKSNNS